MRPMLLPLCLAMASTVALSASATAGDGADYGYHKGRFTPTTYNWKSGNHPWLGWRYPSTYPWSTPVTYNAGPGNYYPAHRARLKQASQRNHRWTGYAPRHFYVVDYNGYAPQYGFYPQ